MEKLLLVLLISLSSLTFTTLAGGRSVAEDKGLPEEAIKALSTGTEFFLYSLDPGLPSFGPTPEIKPGEGLNGFKILGRLRLTEPKSRAIAVAAVNDANLAADHRLEMLCFMPRHALQVTANRKAFDFMICYECGKIKLYRDGLLLGKIGIPNTPESLNKLLSDAKIPLATREHRK